VLESDARLGETRVKPLRHEVHMKSAFEFHHLENFLSVRMKRKAQWNPHSTDRRGLRPTKRRREGHQARVLPISVRTASITQTQAWASHCWFNFRRSLRV